MEGSVRKQRSANLLGWGTELSAPVSALGKDEPQGFALLLSVGVCRDTRREVNTQFGFIFVHGGIGRVRTPAGLPDFEATVPESVLYQT